MIIACQWAQDPFTPLEWWMLEPVTRVEWIEAMAGLGFHSNHPVMLLGDHTFTRTPEGACFASRRALGCEVLTCDPLVAPEGLAEALASYDKAHRASPVVMVGISEPTAQVLAARDYQVVKIGEEPWVDLGDHAPRGNRGKGIRAARNQAIRAGCTVEAWSRAQLLARRDEVEAVFEAWRGMTLLSLEGGVLGTDPFVELPDRRYFVCQRDNQLEAVLVATAIRPGISYYLEDLVYRRDASRGVQELLTLGAMEALAAGGARQVSLGLVFLRKMERGALEGGSGLEKVLAGLKRVVGWCYNAEGQDLFRKRFQVARWEGAYLAFRGPRPPLRDTPRFSVGVNLAWSLLAAFRTLEPKLNWPW